MSDKYVEKTFLYLVVLSVLLHTALFLIIIYLPQEKKVFRQEPYMVELRDLPPTLEPAAKEKKEVRRLDEQRRRVARETAPRGEMERDKIAALPPRAVPPVLPQPEPEAGGAPAVAGRGEAPLLEKPRPADFFRQKERGVPDISKLFPTADKLAKLEESYRRKYDQEVAEGETRFLNTDDIRFGSFLRRFESAVYGVWRYPADAARMGIEGVVPTRITFNRKGEIEKVELLESSGSRILDDEVRRTLKIIGPVGSFPRGYDKDTFHLIAFFHYGIVRGNIQGTLH
ncbi:MAG: TonB family protein [Geobacteraceae bacterium]|nr:TonB family protein [Geobacteraceae bacterium]